MFGLFETPQRQVGVAVFFACAVIASLVVGIADPREWTHWVSVGVFLLELGLASLVMQKPLPPLLASVPFHCTSVRLYDMPYMGALYLAHAGQLSLMGVFALVVSRGTEDRLYNGTASLESKIAGVVYEGLAWFLMVWWFVEWSLSLRLRRQYETAVRTVLARWALAAPPQPHGTEPARRTMDLALAGVVTTTRRRKACDICLKVYLKRRFRQLVCGHAFHARCIDTWLARNRTCPTCRAAVDRPIAPPV